MDPSCWPLRFWRSDKGLLISAKQRNFRLKTATAVKLQRHNLSEWQENSVAWTSLAKYLSTFWLLGEQCHLVKTALIERRKAALLESVLTKTTNKEGSDMIVSMYVYSDALQVARSSNQFSFVLIHLCFSMTNLCFLMIILCFCSWYPDALLKLGAS